MKTDNRINKDFKENIKQTAYSKLFYPEIYASRLGSQLVCGKLNLDLL